MTLDYGVLLEMMAKKNFSASQIWQIGEGAGL